jgi:hypothetical protein
VERKRYLELCQRNAVQPKSVVVWFDGIGYYPIEYRLGFDGEGKSVHRAVLHDMKANSIINCSLEEVKENEKD